MANRHWHFEVTLMLFTSLIFFATAMSPSSEHQRHMNQFKQADMRFSRILLGPLFFALGQYLAVLFIAKSQNHMGSKARSGLKQLARSTIVFLMPLIPLAVPVNLFPNYKQAKETYKQALEVVMLHPRGRYLILFLSLQLLVTSYSPLIALINAAKDPLRDVPGPFLARFTRLWKLLKVHGGSFEEANFDLHQKYGPIVRYAPGTYSIDDPDAVRIIYGLGGQFIKSAWYTANDDPMKPNLFNERNEKIHTMMRRKIGFAYSTTGLLQMEPFVNECAEVFQTRLSEFANSGETIDMAHWLQCFTFDVIAKITLGQRLGFLDSGKDIAGLSPSFYSYLGYFSRMGSYPEIHTFLFKLLTSISGKKAPADIQYLQDFIHKILVERMENPGKRRTQDFINSFETTMAQKPYKVGFEDLFDACFINFAAGSDSTGVALTAALYYLLKHPGTFETLRKEIDEHAEAKGTMSQFVLYQEALKMPYLQAVIKEALRVHSIGHPLERDVGKGGAVISGRFFPEGTIVGINPWVAHRNASVFGQEPEKFRPERWLDAPEDRLAAMERYSMSFGMGSRTCIGKTIGLMEINKIVPLLVREFDFELHCKYVDNGEKGGKWKTDNRVFVFQKGFHVKVVKRCGADEKK